ncbi:MAG: CsgG/HfaB family protein, partial [Thermoanaerobaculia bacterium]
LLCHDLRLRESNERSFYLGLTFTEYDGPKTRLAVMKVENTTGQVEQAGDVANAVLVTHRVAEVPIGSIEELLTTALYKTSRFELIERKAVATVLAEQDFGASDRVGRETAAKVGNVLGAQYLIFAAVNEWTPEKEKTGGALGGIAKGALGLVRANKSKAEVAMSFRVVDATSGQILFSTTERATAGSWGIGLGGFGGGLGGALGKQKNAPINYAVYSCINKGTYRLANWLKDRGWRGVVVKVDGDRIFINAGSDKGINHRMVLTCLAKGEELIDPTTGLSLGADTAAIGSMQVTTVNDKFSIAMVIQGCAGLQNGDFVEVESNES